MIDCRTCRHIWADVLTFSVPEQGISVYERLCSVCGLPYADGLEMADDEADETAD